MNNLNDIIKADLCLGCGICAIDNSIVLKYSPSKGHIIPKGNTKTLKNAKLAFDICPGKGYKIESNAIKLGFGKYHHLDLGFYDELSVTTSNNPNILKRASSSGIMTTLANHLIETKRVDKVIVARFDYTNDGPVAIAYSASNLNEILESQGSKYCPVDFSTVITELYNNVDKKYAFIGTPCQIASIRQIQSNIKDLGVKYFIGNFCGGFKSYNNFRRIIKQNKIEPKDVLSFRFRGGGQPGSMKIITSNKTVQVPYPEYVEMTGYSKLKRCHFCVDANAELADFSCGDAWLPKFTETKIPTSIVITRTADASQILKEIAISGEINSQTISQDDVIRSQIGNIATKKHRQRGRLKLYTLLGSQLPKIDEGFDKNQDYSLRFELNVYLSHKTKFIFEKLNLFVLFYYKKSLLRKVMFRLFKDNYN